MGDLPLELGQTVLSKDGRQGVIRYIGDASFATGVWLGLELPDDKGKNDGSVNGERYFECQPGFGIFVRPESIIEILKHPTIARNEKLISKTINRATTKPRPSSGLEMDTARKRQSLNGTGSNPGSRLSLRSPTKSPTKPMASTASSAASTPRTTTPTTATARTSDSSGKSRLSTSSRPSMGPPATNPTISRASRQSLSGPPSKNNVNKNMNSVIGTDPKNPIRQSLLSRQEVNGVERRKQSDTLASPTINEEDDNLATKLNGGTHDTTPSDLEIGVSSPSLIELAEPAHTMPITQSSSRGGFESKAAVQREMEQLRSKIRILEKKRQEDRDKIKSADILKAEKDRFEIIVQALQKKLQSSQQEISDLRERYTQAESRASQLDNKEGEHESEIENAMLDKEMAEERAESLDAELQVLKIKNEELEIEAELLREQNNELSSVMSPEEKANAGLLSLEREKDRMKEALLALRDMSQQTESDLRSQVKDLESDLRQCDGILIKYQDSVEKLTRSEATNKHLMEQLEAAESHEEVNLNLELEKDGYIREIKELRSQLQAVQEEVNVNDELERYHIETQKELQEELDMRQMLLQEEKHSSNEKAKIIEDQDYTLAKFRDLVSGLQTEISELRISRNISESEASAMNNKSRAIMDLNLKLQSTASKSQMKTIDIELDRLKAEETAQHLSIVQMFVPESFAQESNPIMALLCFKRIKSKAATISSVLRDRSKAAQDLLREDQFANFDVLEKLTWISICCDRFIWFISSCTVQEFSEYQNAIYELEPVERAMNAWIDVLRRDELLNKNARDDLSRMIALLSDLAEKLITSSLQSKACELASRSANVENLLDITTVELNLLADLVRSQVRGNVEGEEFLHFAKRMDQLSSKARTIRAATIKVTEGVRSQISDGLALTEPSWDIFLRVENLAKELAHLVRKIGENVLVQACALERTETPTFAQILDVITNSAKALLQSAQPGQSNADDGMSILGMSLQQLHTNVDQMQYVASDVSNTAEFEKRPAPWIVRSKELSGHKIVPLDTEEELKKLKAQVQDQVLALNNKDRQLEENGIKIEHLESRTKDSRQYMKTIQKLEAELETLKRAKTKADADLEKMKDDYRFLAAQHERGLGELKALKNARVAGDQTRRPGNAVPQDETSVLQLAAEIEYLKQEIFTLQSAIRFVKRANRHLTVPSSSLSPIHSWLNPSSLSRPRPSETASLAAAESKDIFGRLLDLAVSVQPVTLKERDSKRNTSWRAVKSTSRYQALKQREEFEKWSEQKDDLLKQLRVRKKEKVEKRSVVKGLNLDLATKPIRLDNPGTPNRESSHGVTIIGSPP